LERKESLVIKGIKEIKELLVLLEIKEKKVLRDHLAIKVHLD